MNTGAQPPFKYPRDTYAVRVENIAPCVGRHEVIELFSNLIGHVRKCEENISDELGRYMDVAFFSRDASRKALCMSGYTVAGVPLSVSALAPPRNHNYANRGNGADERRNLYVLGLPFNLTKTEYTELFAQYGNVEHSVILATVDNASRRRGFIVMASHAEAKAAMDGLSRAEIKGHIIDVSWAVVQRSHGFLDGGDRMMGMGQRDTVSPTMHPNTHGPPQSPHGYFPQAPMSSQSSSSSLPGLSSSTSTLASEASAYVRTGSVGTPTRPSSSAGVRTELEEHHVTRLVTQEPSAVLLVRDLPALLFSADHDLHPLFLPFGEVRRLERLKATIPPAGRLTPPKVKSPASSLLSASPAASPKMGTDAVAQAGKNDAKVPGMVDHPTTKLSVVVEYTSVSSAIEARQSLQGQTYGSDMVRADFVELPSCVDTSPMSVDNLRANCGTSGFTHTSAADVDRDFVVQDRGFNKRHSMASFGLTVDVTPSSPPHSARSLGGFYDRQVEYNARYLSYDHAYDAPPHMYNRGYDAYDCGFAAHPSAGYDASSNTYDNTYGSGGAFGNGLASGYEREKQRQREYEREREREREIVARRSMYDRSNNTSPFPGGRGLLSPHAVHHGSGYGMQQGFGSGGYTAGGSGENRFGAIARPLSSAARFPPQPASAGAGPGGFPRSKFDELRYAEYPLMGPRRDVRVFQSMPNVFDIPSAAGGLHA